MQPICRQTVQQLLKIEENLKKLHIPEGYTPLYGVALGYKLEPNEPNPRKDIFVNWVK